MNSGQEEEYLGVAETARLLQVHENTIRNWVRSGVLRSAKLPGARAHRFARTDVEQLRQDRGLSASRAGRTLRRDAPELAGHIELDQWAAQLDSKAAFPELMDRLLSRTPGVANVNVRSHEGTAAHGWDGTADCDQAPFLPRSKLYFEFGTNEDPEKKADEDYDNRRGALAEKVGNHFIFATPRNWPGGKKWATEKSALGEYESVEVLDAHRLTSWLREVPSVHQWVSERLGFRPRDVQTLDQWWQRFQGGLRVAITPEFFVAGRAGAVTDLLRHLSLKSQGSYVVTIEAASEIEGLAFLYAALQDEDKAESVLVVRGPSAWGRLVQSKAPLVLVPLFDDVDHSVAIKQGHRIVLIASQGEVLKGSAVKLGRVNPIEAGSALDKTVSNLRDRARLVPLARKNMRAFLRDVSLDQRLVTPEWATNLELAQPLARLMLASCWSNSDSDHGALESMVERTWPELERLLMQQERHEGLFIRSGDTWQLSAPTDAAALLLPVVSPHDLDKWGDVVTEVLRSTSPYLGMSDSERLTVQLKGARPKYSSALRRGFALSLALVASSDLSIHGVGRADAYVERIVSRIWRDAAGDESGKLWQSLSDVMPLLAEAAPEAFLQAIEEDLDRQTPIVRSLFSDQDADTYFGPSSPHTGLLWALESLAWSRKYFHRAVDALARLEAIDPGGKLANRPAKSLLEILQGWIRNSGGTTADKIVALETMATRHPDVARKLLIALLPELHLVSFPPHAPTYRDWVPSSNGVSMPDWVEFASAVARIAASSAGSHGTTWGQLITRIDKLPRTDRRELLHTLQASVATDDWSPDDIHGVWQALDELIRQHEEFADAEWALDSNDIAELRSAADALPINTDPRRFIGLFGWHRTFDGLRYDDEGYRDAIGEARNKAVEAVLADGIDGLALLTRAVKNPQSIGWAAAYAPAARAIESNLLAWLDRREDNLRSAATAFVSVRIRAEGWSWLEQTLPLVRELTDSGKALFAATIPFTRAYWRKLDDLAPDIAPLYWNQNYPVLGDNDEFEEAAIRLIAEGHSWAAITLVSNTLHTNEASVSLDIVKRALSAALSSSEPIHDTTMTPYHIEQILEHFERESPDDPDLPKYEFALFRGLHDHQPATALYRSLNERPDEFVNMMTAMFRAEGEERRTLSVPEQNYANVSWDVIHHWRTIPGQMADGAVDGTKLARWVRDARLALEERGRLTVGDEQIGEILAASPIGSDGLWPAEAVREVVEATGSARLETGLQIGRTNLRGIVSKSVYEGGEQERRLQRQYEEWAVALGPRWRRTSRVLRQIADSYGWEAQREDEQAERDADSE